MDSGAVLVDEGPSLQGYIERYLTWRDCSEEDYAAFHTYARSTTVRLTELFCGLFLLALPVYFLVDVLALGTGPELAASVRWRTGTGFFLLVGAVGAHVMHRTGLDRWAYPLGIFGGTLMCAIIGTATSPATHLGSVTTSAFLLLPLCSVPVLGNLSLRVVATVLPSVGVVAGFVWRSPAHLHDPDFAYFLSVMVFACVLSIGSGHALSHMIRHGFLLSRRISTLASSLEQRVRDRTRELQELFEHLEHAKEQERLRIARDVHDEFGQLLSASALALDRARSLEQTALRDEELTRARQLLGQAMAAVSGMLSDMRPRTLEDSGLEGAFALLLDEHEKNTGSECLWSIECEVSKLPSSHAVTVFRSLQECLRNIGRHARARRIEALLAEDAGSVFLEVRDDGVGFEPEKRREGSFGLLGMRERAEALRGTFELESSPGKGTRVRITLPLEQAPS